MLSSGVVIVRPTGKNNLFLLLRAFKYWDFPKGLVEEGEDPLEAACREAKEETGLTDFDFRWGDLYQETEPYGRGKVARYYIAETPQSEIQLPISAELGRPEHHEARWMSYEEARLVLVPRVQKILDWANGVLQKEGAHGPD